MPRSPQEIAIAKLQSQLALQKIAADLSVFNQNQTMVLICSRIRTLQLNGGVRDHEDLQKINQLIRHPLAQLFKKVERAGNANEPIGVKLLNSLMLLANYWPLNTYDHEREAFMSPFLDEPINENNKVVSPTGTQYSINAMLLFLVADKFAHMSVHSDSIAKTALTDQEFDYLKSSVAGKIHVALAHPEYKKLRVNQDKSEQLSSALYGMAGAYLLMLSVFGIYFNGLVDLFVGWHNRSWGEELLASMTESFSLPGVIAIHVAVLTLGAVIGKFGGDYEFQLERQEFDKSLLTADAQLLAQHQVFLNDVASIAAAANHHYQSMSLAASSTALVHRGLDIQPSPNKEEASPAPASTLRQRHVGKSVSNDPTPTPSIQRRAPR